MRVLGRRVVQFGRQGFRSILITSAWPGEGKSTVCLNLALALCDLSQKVTLVDGDLRMRTLTRHHSILPPAAEKLTFFPAPEPRAHPAEQLTEPDYRAKVAEQGRNSDLMLIDTPALSNCSDALMLAPWVDGAILVTSKKLFRGIPEGNFSEDLRDHGIPILGVVVNRS